MPLGILRPLLLAALVVAALTEPSEARQPRERVVLTLQPGSLSVGNDVVCGIRDDGTAICWGNDSNGQADPPAGKFVAVSAGGSDSERSCGIRPGGIVACWGAKARLTPPGRFHQISTGGYDPGTHRSTGCGVLVSGRAECWTIHGHKGAAFLTATLRPGQFTQVSAGGGFACGVRADGRLSCWGRAMPRLTPPVITVRQVGVWGLGSFDPDKNDPPTACALTKTGSAVCWGSSRWGQERTPAETDLAAVAVGRHFACGLRTSGGSVCWGSEVPIAPWQARWTRGPMTQLRVGGAFLCKLRPLGTVSCIGDDDNGQGDVPGRPLKTASAGGDGGCGVRVDGSLLCWGPGYGPTPYLSPSARLASFAVDGANGGCGVRIRGTLWCWEEQATPPNGKFESVAGGASGFCAIGESTGRLTCWGNFDRGPPRGSFSQVSVAIGSSSDFGCALAASRKVRCWGDDTVPGGNPTGQTRPPSGLFKAVSVASGGACALSAYGTPVCWGEAGSVPPGRFRSIGVGQFGENWRLCGLTFDGSLECGKPGGTRTERLGGPYVSLSVGDDEVCAVDARGGLRCWGGSTVRLPSL